MRKKIAIFITAFAILVATNPAEAQQAGKMFRTGYLSRDFAERHKGLRASFWHGPREPGNVEGKNIDIVWRYGQGNRDRLTQLAADTPGTASASSLIDSTKALAGVRAGEMTLIDVRSPAEWRQTGVPQGARTVTIHDPRGMAGFVTAVTRAVNGQKNEPIALICARGGRSSRAERALRAAGFSNIFNVREGMLGNPIDGPGWLRRRLPVEGCKNC